MALNQSAQRSRERVFVELPLEYERDRLVVDVRLRIEDPVEPDPFLSKRGGRIALVLASLWRAVSMTLSANERCQLGNCEGLADVPGCDGDTEDFEDDVDQRLNSLGARVARKNCFLQANLAAPEMGRDHH